MSKSKQSRNARPRSPEARHELTAGDVARLLRVDLKTIHNWVNQGRVFAQRTEGRHLRFQRVEVVRYLRRFGHDVPASLGRPRPRVVLAAAAKQRARGSDGHFAGDGFMGSVLEAAAGAYEVFVIALDGSDAAMIDELVRALRARPETRTLSLIGLSKHPARRARFLRVGGDLTLASSRPADLSQAVRFVTGAIPSLPRGASQ